MDPVKRRALLDMTWKLGDFDSAVSSSIKISKCNLKRRKRRGKESEKIKQKNKTHTIGVMSVQGDQTVL